MIHNNLSHRPPLAYSLVEVPVHGDETDGDLRGVSGHGEPAPHHAHLHTVHWLLLAGGQSCLVLRPTWVPLSLAWPSTVSSSGTVLGSSTDPSDLPHNLGKVLQGPDHHPQHHKYNQIQTTTLATTLATPLATTLATTLTQLPTTQATTLTHLARRLRTPATRLLHIDVFIPLQ